MTTPDTNLKPYSVTLCWDDRYVVAAVEAANVAAAIAAAYEWAGDGGYDEQDTFDGGGGETYVGHIAEHPTLADAERAGSLDGDPLPIPFEHLGDSEKLAIVTLQRNELRAALAALHDRVIDVTKNAGYGAGLFEPEMAAARVLLEKVPT